MPFHSNNDNEIFVAGFGLRRMHGMTEMIMKNHVVLTSIFKKEVSLPIKHPL